MASACSVTARDNDFRSAERPGNQQLPTSSLLLLIYVVMDCDHRRSKKRPSGGKGVLSLVLSCSLFSGAIAANLPVYFGSPLRDSPLIPPQIPLGGSPSSENTHEFVSWAKLREFYLVYGYHDNRESI